MEQFRRVLEEHEYMQVAYTSTLGCRVSKCSPHAHALNGVTAVQARSWADKRGDARAEDGDAYDMWTRARGDGNDAFFE